MSNQARKIIVVTTDAMMNDALYRKEKFLAKSKVSAMLAAINTVCDEREAFEERVERRLADGSFITGQSADIKHVRALKNNEAVARMFVALNVNPRAYVFPQSQDGGKTSAETSNLKSYKKLREVAESVWSGSSTLENVVKVWSVCAFKSARDFSTDVLSRDFSENFLTSRAFKSIHQGSNDFWSAVDDVRAKHMSTGAATQTSQMVRTLVALGSAVDVREGRAKHTRINADGLVLNALMRRFGIVTDVTAEEELADLDNSAPVTDGDVTVDVSDELDTVSELSGLDDSDAQD